MIRIQNLQKTFGERMLFDDVNLTLGSKERIGLIGRNGSGKSTFLRMLLGQESIQGGEVEIPSGFTIRALEQHLNFIRSTLLEQVVAALPSGQRAEAWRAKSILMGLGFGESDFARAPQEFSSGFQVRIRLAEALVSDCDLLLLDEPTNYLDILSLRWLERFLKGWRTSFLLVTHDQRFMTQVVSHTIALHRGRMRKLRGGPQKLMEQIRQEEQVYEKTRQNQVKKKERTEEFIRAFRSGARSAGLVQSRIKALAKQKVGQKLELLPQIRFRFRSEPFQANSMLQAEDLSFGYEPGKPLIQGLSLTLFRGDRIAIIGRNGQGKSTLLRLLAQKAKPWEGKVVPHAALKVGYFGAGNQDRLDPQKMLLEQLGEGLNLPDQALRNVAGALLFSGMDSKKKISSLSGGEKSRVCLGRLMLDSHHLLLLDEPTNHLDMESCQALIEALNSFEGSVIFVTHDEEILSQVATRLILFEGGTVRLLEKTYDRFLDEVGWKEEEGGSTEAPSGASPTQQAYAEKKDRKKQLRRIQAQILALEKEIGKWEKEKATTEKELGDACIERNRDQIRRLGMRLKELEELIERAYAEYQDLEEQFAGLGLDE